MPCRVGGRHCAAGLSSVLAVVSTQPMSAPFSGPLSAALTGESPLYYALLLPAALPVLLLFVVVNWVALKFFRAN